MKIAIIMSGPNIVGRIFADKLKKFHPEIFLDQTSKRALRTKNWLDPDYRSNIRLENCVYFKNINEIQSDLKQFDYAINGGGLGILKTNLINCPSVGWVNGHPGLLPEYRGANPVQWAISNLDPVGATIHFIDEGIDTGPILIRKTMPWRQFKTVKDCHIQCYEYCGDLLQAFFENPNQFPPVSQKKRHGTYRPVYGNGDLELENENLHGSLLSMNDKFA